VVEWE